MKKYALMLAAAGFGVAAQAQTNVTVYGIVDTSIRYVSSDNAKGDHNIRMDNGAVTNSRLGFKGTEDLGDGLKAIFKLENGFNGDNGSSSAPGLAFSRKAYVGVSGKLGELTLGRQNTPMFDLLGDQFDPLTVGNYDSNSWLPVGASLVRTSNMVKYYGVFNGLAVGASYAFGEQAGSNRLGRQMGLSLQYTTGPFSVGGAAQQTVSATNADFKDTAYNLSASYVLGAAKLFAGYLNIKDSTGTTAAYFAGNNSPANAGGIPGVQRKDNGYFLGATYQATPLWSLTGVGYYDKSKNDSVKGIGNLGDGTRYSLNGVAEYSLSKRTQVYGAVDYNKVKDGATAELVGKTNITSLGLGVRHSF